MSQTATNQAQLVTYLGDTATDVVLLGVSLTISDGSTLTVSQTKAKTLDLGGYTLTITSVTAGAAIDVSAAAPTDPGSCSGLSVTGSQAGGYQIAYITGSFAVNPAPATVTATGTVDQRQRSSNLHSRRRQPLHPASASLHRNYTSGGKLLRRLGNRHGRVLTFWTSDGSTPTTNCFADPSDASPEPGAPGVTHANPALLAIAQIGQIGRGSIRVARLTHARRA